ncbi:hypothetical protein CC78DRAFT_580673 [Lojkania enalia]|uniref:SRR1-like domain-containing protein n=1 Tax=Lojkania enalia TaxID=147567 RepID=A0A9P4MZV1_9PLEO|nr:hypothetical protein CC78DRAFT_580673 [Didymosphaeria enalia]
MEGQGGRSKGRVKRRQVQAGDGWTVVTHRSNEEKVGQSTEALQHAKPTRVVAGLTIERLREDFEKLEGRWRDTECAVQVVEMLRKRDWDVHDAVCIGIGSFSLDWEHRFRALWQLVLFRAVVRLATKPGPHVCLYAQEPAFTSLDISFLAALNITVLESNIESHISPTSFVFAPFVDWNILLLIFLKSKDPLLYIGNEVLDDYGPYAKSEEKEKIMKECNELGKSFLQGRACARISEFKLHPHALNGLAVYWRTAQESGEQE